MNRPKLRLISDSVSHEMVECLQELTDLAREGKLIGLAYGALMVRNEFFVNTAGHLTDNPLAARGIVATLDDELSESIWDGHR